MGSGRIKIFQIVTHKTTQIINRLSHSKSKCPHALFSSPPERIPLQKILDIFERRLSSSIFLASWCSILTHFCYVQHPFRPTPWATGSSKAPRQRNWCWVCPCMAAASPWLTRTTLNMETWPQAPPRPRSTLGNQESWVIMRCVQTAFYSSFYVSVVVYTLLAVTHQSVDGQICDKKVINLFMHRLRQNQPFYNKI